MDNSNQHILDAALEYCVDQQLAFVAYREPGNQTYCLMPAKSTSKFNIEEIDDKLKQTGFVMAPFDSEKNALVFISPVDCYSNKTAVQFNSKIDLIEKLDVDTYLNSSAVNTTYASYEAQYKYYQKQIENKVIRKAILSRIKIESVVDRKNAHLYFLDLCEKYPNAFVYLVHTKETGMWMGASPELFLEVKGEKVTTVALAGTKKGDNGEWCNKEIDEQAIVTEYIGDVLKEFEVHNYSQKGPFTIDAGKIAHLKTIFDFNSIQLNAGIGAFIQRLHPTPAVCGLPKKDAMVTILCTEKHQREFYAGFLGPVEKGKAAFYVNIRCLKYISEGVALYLGGGITSGSDSCEEWDETELKAQTLLSVLKNN